MGDIRLHQPDRRVRGIGSDQVDLKDDTDIAPILNHRDRGEAVPPEQHRDVLGRRVGADRDQVARHEALGGDRTGSLRRCLQLGRAHQPRQVLGPEVEVLAIPFQQFDQLLWRKLDPRAGRGVRLMFGSSCCRMG